MDALTGDDAKTAAYQASSRQKVYPAVDHGHVPGDPPIIDHSGDHMAVRSQEVFHVFDASGGEIVQQDNRLPPGDERIGNVRPDEASTASDEIPHCPRSALRLAGAEPSRKLARLLIEL